MVVVMPKRRRLSRGLKENAAQGRIKKERKKKRDDAGCGKVKKCEGSWRHKANIRASKNTVGFAPFPRCRFPASSLKFFFPSPSPLESFVLLLFLPISHLPFFAKIFTAPFNLRSNTFAREGTTYGKLGDSSWHNRILRAVRTANFVSYLIANGYQPNKI